jgi:hypothetical protein
VLAEINTVAAAFSDQLIEKSDYCRNCSSFKQLINHRSIFNRRRKNSFHGYENSLGKWRDLKLCNLLLLLILCGESEFFNLFLFYLHTTRPPGKKRD